MKLKSHMITIMTLAIVGSCGNPTKQDLRARSVEGAADVQKNKLDPQSQALDPSASGGSGGAFGLREFSFITENSVELKVKTSPSEANLSEPQGLMVYFHSEGAADYDWMFPALVEIGKKKSLIPVALKTQTKTSWDGNSELAASAIRNLIEEEFFKNYNIKKNRIIFVGSSTGANYLVEKLTNDTSFQIARGAILMCGGALSKVGTAIESTKDDWKAQFKIVSVMSSSDTKANETAGLKEHFDKLKISFESIDPKTSGHCRFDGREQLDVALSKLEA